MQLFQKNEENSHYKAEKCGEMIPLKSLTLEHYSNKNCKYCKGNNFLNDFKLHKIERTSVFDESYPVGWYLGTIFEECHSPGEKNYNNKRPTGRNFHFLQLEMTIPGECHEYI
jgi:hypothetical protein